MFACGTPSSILYYFHRLFLTLVFILLATACELLFKNLAPFALVLNVLVSIGLVCITDYHDSQISYHFYGFSTMIPGILLLTEDVLQHKNQ